MGDEYVVAIHPYNLEGSPYELKIQSGDRIRVVLKDPSGWWQGELNGVVGLFPSNFTIMAPPPSPAIKRKALSPLPSIPVVSTPLIDQSYSTGGPPDEERASIMERIKVATSLEEVEALEKKLKAYYPSKQSVIKTWPPTEADAQEALLSTDSSKSPPLDSEPPSTFPPPSLPPGLTAYPPPSYNTYPPSFPPNFTPSQFPSTASYSPYFSYEASSSQSMYFSPVNGFTTSFPQHEMAASSSYAYYARPPPSESFPRYSDSPASSTPTPAPPAATAPANEWETTGSSNGVTLDCRHWLRGFCRMGAGCRFSHAGARGSATTGTTPSQFSSPPVCRHHLKGYCQMGAGCSFSHADSSDTPTPPGTEETKPKGITSFSFAAKSECRLYQQGQCRLGTNCPFGHFDNPAPSPPPPAASSENGWTTSELPGTEMTE